MKKFTRKPWIWSIAVVLVVAVAVAGYLFQPWLLWVDTKVDEALPEVTQSASDQSAGVEGSPSAAPDGPVALAGGEFVSQEHETSGSVQIVQEADGSLLLAIAGLDTSNGPDLRVWLTDQAVDPDEWFVFDDGYYIELGELKGNIGDQTYEIPSDVDLDKVTSVSIWCKRFAVSFGAAALS